MRRRIPSPSLFRTNKYGLGKEGKRIDPGLGVRGRNGKRVTVKHNGNDGTENGFVKKIWCLDGNGNGIVLKPVFKYGFFDGKTT